MKQLRLVILCGGSGFRLWPESRASLPKQFITLLKDKSLLDLTIERILNIKTRLKPIFICNKKHGFLVRESIKKYKLKAHIFLEPEGKDTCAAIYLAAKFCEDIENLLIMPCDHIVSDIKKFTKEILIINKNLTPDRWITLGIKPTKPSEAYGYIKVFMNRDNNLKKVSKFFEKPNINFASELIKNNCVFWNAGIFMGNAKFIMNSIKKHSLNIAQKCDQVFDHEKTTLIGDELSFCQNMFAKIPSKSIDYAVMEKEDNIFLHELKCKWSDVGSWDAVADISQVKNKNNIVEINSENNFIRNGKRVIATIGVKDLIIIDNDNATLISKKNESEKVKLAVNKLMKRNIIEAEEHSFEKRPWGKFENLFTDLNSKVKRLIIHPKQRLSLQYHNFRSEHWLVTEGIANIYLDGVNMILTKGKSIDIPVKSHHYIENKEKTELIIIETQLGSYFGEDDIVRLDDPYSR